MMDWTVEEATDRIQKSAGKIRRALRQPENPTCVDFMIRVRLFCQFMKNLWEAAGTAQVFQKITLNMMEKFVVDVSSVRMDSADVESDIRDLRRYRLNCVTVQLFLKKLGRSCTCRLGETVRGLRVRFGDAREIGGDLFGQMD
jgi:hypothetical protein